MAVISASIRRVTGVVRGLRPGPACGPPPGMVPTRPAGPVSPAVDAYENQHDEREDDHHEHSGAGEVMTRPVHEDRDTSQHQRSPTELPQDRQADGVTIRLEYQAVYLLRPAPARSVGCGYPRCGPRKW